MRRAAGCPPCPPLPMPTTAPAVAAVQGNVTCEQPNNSLYTFTGNLNIMGKTLPLGPDQVGFRKPTPLLGCCYRRGACTSVLALR